MAAILVFMRETSSGNTNPVPTLLLVLFGLILSVIGFLIMVSLTFGHHNHKTNAIMILYYWDKMEFFTNPKKPVYYKTLHRWFFEITIALFAALSLLSYVSEDWVSPEISYGQKALLISAFIIIFLGIEGLYRWRWRKYTGMHIYFREILRNDTEGHYRENWDFWFKGPRPWKRIIKDAKKKTK